MNRKVFFAEIKRCHSLGVVLCIIGVVFSICFDSWNDLLRAIQNGKGSVHYFFMNSGFGGVCRAHFLPVFATLPFATSFCSDYRTNVLSYIVVREGKIRYCIIKYLLTVFISGLIVAVATGILFLFLSSLFPIANEAYQGAEVSDVFHLWMAEHHPIKYGCVEVGNGFLRGALWSGIALCVSTYIPDTFITIVSPYLISMAISQAERMWMPEFSFRLEFMMTGRYIVRSSMFTLTICFIIITFILFIVAIITIKKMLRRIQNE